MVFNYLKNLRFFKKKNDSDDYANNSNNSNNEDSNEFLQKLLAEQSSAETELIERIKEILLPFNIRDADLTIINKTDSVEIKKLKKHLIYLQKYVQKRSKKLDYHRSYSQKNLRYLKETAEDIRRFLNFDHNRDHDGKLNSLGEHSGNRSPHEQKIENMIIKEMRQKHAKNVKPDHRHASHIISQGGGNSRSI
ncbi:MAG: hypothetical protein AAF195_00035 [Pseudomonadota bacterium]